MGIIRVAIQENVKIVGISLTEGNDVDFNLVQGEEVDALAALTGDGDLSGPDVSNVRVFALKNESYGEQITGKKLVETINAYKAFFNEILLQYVPSTEISWGGMFNGVDVKTGEDVEKLSTSEVSTVGKNIVTYFVQKMGEVDLTKKLRFKFYRQNAAKNFISIKPEMFTRFGKVKPSGFRNTWTVPFVESMDIPKEASKLAYDDFERGFRNGAQTGLDLSNPDQVKADAAPSGPADLPF